MGHDRAYPVRVPLPLAPFDRDAAEAEQPGPEIGPDERPTYDIVGIPFERNYPARQDEAEDSA
jgi:hypothetical protein